MYFVVGQSIHHRVIEILIPVRSSSWVKHLSSAIISLSRAALKTLNFFLVLLRSHFKTDLPPFFTLNLHTDLVHLSTFKTIQELCLLAEKQPMYRKVQPGPSVTP